MNNQTHDLTNEYEFQQHIINNFIASTRTQILQLIYLNTQLSSYKNKAKKKQLTIRRITPETKYFKSQDLIKCQIEKSCLVLMRV